MLDLTGLEELRYVKREDGRIRIGALTTIADLQAQNDNSVWGPFIRGVAERFGSPNIRSVATVGGNLCGACSSEDLIPVFLTLDANVKTIRKNRTREMTLREFVVDKRKTALEAGEILVEVSFPEPNTQAACSFQKLGMRNTLIIALVSVAAFIEASKADFKIKSARIALNRLTGRIPERAQSVEKELVDRKLDRLTVDAVADALGKELSLTSDFRASADYRREAVKVLLRRALIECQEAVSKK